LTLTPTLSLREREFLLPWEKVRMRACREVVQLNSGD